MSLIVLFKLKKPYVEACINECTNMVIKMLDDDDLDLGMNYKFREWFKNICVTGCLKSIKGIFGIFYDDSSTHHVESIEKILTYLYLTDNIDIITIFMGILDREMLNNINVIKKNILHWACEKNILIWQNF